jgi:hypothetical protein
MNYEFHYQQLIEKAKSRNNHGYTEKHHIIPRCIGGSNNRDNLVNLTPEEHYIAHQLLVKMYPDNNKLIMAAAMMIPNRPSNKLYGWLKRRWARAMSESQTGKNNTQFGTKWIHSSELKQSKKISVDSEIPAGWELGRIVDFDKDRKDPSFNYKRAAYDKRKEEAKKLAHELFDKFKNSQYNSICAFAKANNTTQPRLSMLWKKYVDEFNQNRQQGKSFK